MSGGRSSRTTAIPTWLTGELLAVWMTRSATVPPRKIQRSPVRVASTASSNGTRSVPVRAMRPSVPPTLAGRRHPSSRGYAGAMASNRVWKIIGLAGVVGVVATGALVAKGERERRAYTPDEVRDRLQERLRAAEGREDAASH